MRKFTADDPLFNRTINAIYNFQEAAVTFEPNNASRKKHSGLISEYAAASEELALRIQYALLRSNGLAEFKKNFNELQQLAIQLLTDGKPGIAKAIIDALRIEQIQRLVEPGDNVAEKSLQNYGDNSKLTLVPIPNNVWTKHFEPLKALLDQEDNIRWNLKVLQLLQDVSPPNDLKGLYQHWRNKFPDYEPEVELPKLQDAFNTIEQLFENNAQIKALGNSPVSKISALIIEQKSLLSATIAGLEIKGRGIKAQREIEEKNFSTLPTIEVAIHIAPQPQATATNNHTSARHGIKTEAETPLDIKLSAADKQKINVLTMLSSGLKEYNPKTSAKVNQWKTENQLSVLLTQVDKYIDYRYLKQQTEKKADGINPKEAKMLVALGLRKVLLRNDYPAILDFISTSKKVLAQHNAYHFFMKNEIETIMSKIEKVALSALKLDPKYESGKDSPASSTEFKTPGS